MVLISCIIFGISKTEAIYKLKNSDLSINWNITLFEKKQMTYEWKEIQNKSHQLGAFKVNRILLSRYDDKWYILDGGIKTLAYRH